MHSEIAKNQGTYGLPESVSKISVKKLGIIRKLFARIAFDRANDANCSREHSHSREYSGQNYYVNVRAISSRQCEMALIGCWLC